jgi:hypothetical protein
MTKYADEFDPNSRHQNRGVQEDNAKLKFNNIQTCIAVGIVPEDNSKIIGVHFTTTSTFSKDELREAIGRIKGAGADRNCKVFLVASFGNHEKSFLVQELKSKLTKNIYLYDVPPETSGAANIDVKMVRAGDLMNVYIRMHAELLKGPGGGAVVKPGYAAMSNDEKANFRAAGKNMYETDRDDKPWMYVSCRKI